MRNKLNKYRWHLRSRHLGHAKYFGRAPRYSVARPIIILAVLCVIAVGAFLLLSHTTPKFQPISSYIVTVSHDHEQQVVPTNEPTVGALLSKMDIKIGPHDRVEPDVKTAIKQDNLRVNIYRAVPIEVIDSGQKILALSAATTSRSLVKQAGVNLYPEDLTQTQPLSDSVISGGIRKTIVVTRATPILLNIYGTPALIRTQAKTVGDLMTQKDIKLKDGDRVQPALDTPLTPDTQVYLLHKGVEVTTEFQSIPMPVQVVRDNSLSFGTSAVRQQGAAGQLAITYQITKENGIEVSRTELQQVVIVPPVTQIVAQGQAVSIPADKQAVMALAGISPGDYKYVDYIASHEGSWCPTKIQGTHNCPGYMNPGDVPSYGGYGIFQATPGNKMASAGSDWATDAVTQIRWATSYADSRYGSWQAAYGHKTSQGWW